MHYHRLAAPVVSKVMGSITAWAWHAGRMVAIPSVELAKTGLSGKEAVAEHLSRGRGASFVRYPGIEPEVITVDNGPEFAGKAMDEWAYRRGIKLSFIRLGKPVENAFAESFNGRLRDECLNINFLHECKGMPGRS